MTEKPIDRTELIGLLNEDLSREYQAIIAYTVYSQTIKGAQYNNIADELAQHAGEELEHALKIAKQIDYLGGQPTVQPAPVELSDNPEKLLEFDMENERRTIISYRKRIQQAEELGEYALSETLRGIIAQEQEHLIDLADALGVEVPKLD